MLRQITLLFALLAYANADCREITLDSCGNGIAPPFEQTKGLSIALCEKFCNEIYGDACNSFTYNKKDSTCELYAADPLDFANSCNVRGGSVDVDPFDCINPNDDCAVGDKNVFPILYIESYLISSCTLRDTALIVESFWMRFYKTFQMKAPVGKPAT